MFSIYSSESSRKNASSGTVRNWLRMRVPSALRMRHSLPPIPSITSALRSKGNTLR